MRVAVVDGMGGSIGHHIVSRLHEAFAEEVEIIVIGTNAIATSNMMKAGANAGATGENALKVNLAKVDAVAGPLAILVPNSLMGEFTPAMAEAVAGCTAEKVVLPLRPENVTIVGTEQVPIPHLMDEVIERLADLYEEKGGDRSLVRGARLHRKSGND